MDVTAELDRVARRFGAVRAVEDVSLTVGSGEVVSLIGPSGCGKSTLLELVAGLQEPDAGTVRVLGKDLPTLPGYWPRLRRPTFDAWQIQRRR